MRKKKILILMGRYLPGFKDGGPVRTIVNLVDALHEEFNFAIVTNDRDHHDTKPYPNIKVNEWNVVGNASVYYVPPGGFTFSLLMRLCEDVDLVYCCGPYNDYSQKVMVLKKINMLTVPIVIASMGSFAESALNIKSYKKEMFIKVYDKLGLFSKVIWSVTSKEEEKDLQRVLGDKAISYIAEDLPRKQSYKQKQYNKQVGKLKIVFISRICKTKNLIYAIEVLSKLKGEIEFTIYGNIEDHTYWEYCESLLKKLPSNISWRFEGMADSEKIISTFSKFDLFLFPTLGENYGHVIYEALAAGCVPVISNKTPWLDFDMMDCGRVIPLDRFDIYIKTVQDFVNMDSKRYSDISSNAVQYAAQKYSEAISNNGYKRIFKELI